MEKYRKRIADDLLQDKLHSKGAVLIEGTKWCGKTTTALQAAKSVLNMDKPSELENNIRLSEIDPSILLDGDCPRLIDEWQIAPRLWDAIRYEVDRRGKMGQFILTGSAVPVDSKSITHSGTGRFSWLKMRPMSLYESEESSGEVSLADLFEMPDRISGKNDYNLEKIAFLICRGGWPLSIDMVDKYALLQANDYYDGVINSDISRVDGIRRNSDIVRKVMRSYARHQGTQVANTIIRDDVASNDNSSINEDTISDYINALKMIYVVEEMPSWNPNLKSKTAIRTSDTRYFVDSSIATVSLGLGPKDLINDLNTFGLMFETMCVRDLRVYSQGLFGQVYHYRDKTGLECDSVIHLRNGKYGLVEIKLGGEKLINEGCENLKKLKSKIDIEKMNEPAFMMILTAVGKYAYRREDGIYIVPIGCLKN